MSRPSPIPYWRTDPGRPVPSCGHCHGTGRDRTTLDVAPGRCPRCFGIGQEPTYPPTRAQLRAFRLWLEERRGMTLEPDPTRPEWMDGPAWADALHGGAYIRRQLAADPRGPVHYASWSPPWPSFPFERAHGLPISWRRR